MGLLAAMTPTRLCRFCGFESVQLNEDGDRACLLCTRLQEPPLLPSLSYAPKSERRISPSTRAKLAAAGAKGGTATRVKRDAGCACEECGV